MTPSKGEAERLRRGWCPGALRPMQTGDGMLVRLRLTGGIVPAALARAIADCARRFGNGALDLSGKANLQLRGVTDATLEPLLEQLQALGVLDPDPAAEAVRNVVSSPLAGLDPAEALDVRPVAAALERRLAEDSLLHQLPAKFGYLVDDGGRFAPRDVSVDVRFEAFRTDAGPRFAVRLGGSEATANTIGACAPDAVVEVAAGIAATFIALRVERGPEAPRRMGAMLAQVGLAPFGALAGMEPGAGSWSPPSRKASQPLGPIRLGADSSVFGVGAPFGRWSADDLERLADWSERFGIAELRLTPWRAILMPLSALADLAAFASSRFIVDPADPRLAVAACPGAPDCANASRRTRDDATALAEVARGLAAEGVTLHVSGCAKGCARPEPSDVALTARNGLYDLVRRGRAGDTPQRSGLSLDEARAAIEEMRTG
ncbi:precorrin-3B synthase [Alsobacter soli]|uniref:Precorrin-3B synthase n=1 Tax=Alsobacter soli TaxID=2109933 RepID=A0A2T1HYE3_9HYPH|nr:precorrin-3B synthase [Alsobacter soli]PSC06691.1 precorrin-3B synthase [Alsobacter soli]